MSRTVSVKPIATLTEQCSQCGLWFEFLHPGAGGRFLCRTCLMLEGGNRAAPLDSRLAVRRGPVRAPLHERSCSPPPS
jgi:hypothetical protein